MTSQVGSLRAASRTKKGNGKDWEDPPGARFVGLSWRRRTTIEYIVHGDSASLVGLSGLGTTNVPVSSGVLRGVVGHGDEVVLDHECQRGDLIQLVQAAAFKPSDAHDDYATHGESARSENNFSRSSGFGVRGRILSSTRGDGRWQSFSVCGGSPYRGLQFAISMCFSTVYLLLTRSLSQWSKVPEHRFVRNRVVMYFKR